MRFEASVNILATWELYRKLLSEVFRVEKVEASPQGIYEVTIRRRRYPNRWPQKLQLLPTDMNPIIVPEQK
jgi:hypothetical protein